MVNYIMLECIMVVTMATINQVENNAYSIHPQMNVMFCLSYLVLGDKPALIDPGSTAQARIILESLKSDLGFDLERLAYIIPTHLHLDHGGGAGYVAQQLPQAQVIVHQRYKKHLQNPSTLVKAFKNTFGDDFADNYGQVLPVPEGQIIGIDDGDEIDLGDRILKAFVTRGHANHHISLLDTNTQGLFCGDTLGMYFPWIDGIVVVCPEGFDLDLQLDSIDRLKQIKPEKLFFAHEGTGENPLELMQRTARQLEDCQRVVQASIADGDNLLQTENRLGTYFRSNVSTELNYKKMYLGLTAGGYRKYLQKPPKQVTVKGGN